MYKIALVEELYVYLYFICYDVDNICIVVESSYLFEIINYKNSYVQIVKRIRDKFIY